MEYLYYSLISLLAIVMHVIINHGYWFNKATTLEMKEYKRYLSAVAGYYLADAAWGFFNHMGWSTALYIDTVAYYITMAFSVVFCCRYIVAFLKIKSLWGRTLNTAGVVFGLCSIVGLGVNHFVHIYFWFDEQGEYVALVLRYAALIIQCIMYGCITATSLAAALREKNTTKQRYMTIFHAGICMLIALVLQTFYPLMPFYSVGLLLATLIIHVFIHNEDTNTQLRQIKELNAKMQEEHAKLQEQNNELATTYAIINGLSHDYHSIWWANKEDMHLHIIRATESANMGAVKVGLSDVDADTAMQHYIARYVAEEDRERISQQITTKEVLKQLTKSNFYAVNFTRLNEHGGQDYNQMAFANADTADGKHLFVFGFRDINDILSQEHALRKEREANAAKTQFLHNMSHEIRTPLNAMFGFSQLLGMPDGSCTPEEKAQYNRYIYNSYRMLEMLISDILDIADSEHGNYRINLGEVHINSVCQNALMSVEYRVPTAVYLHMTSDFPDDYVIQSDERRIQQVLINYLTNACKNTQKGEIHLHVSKSENPGKITFSVADTGRGIPPEKASEIFNRFTKLNQDVQGSGLGLSICQTIASKLGGEVYLDTEYPNAGTYENQNNDNARMNGNPNNDNENENVNANKPATGARFVFVIPANAEA